MDLLAKTFAAALTADPLNLALCAVMTLAVALVLIAWKRS